MAKRYHFPLIAALLLALPLFTGCVRQTADTSTSGKVVNIGYQEFGTLRILKARGTLEPALKPLGYTVAWRQFQSGVPVIEAINAGKVDIGHVGEPPPLTAQASGVPFKYVGMDGPSPKALAIVVPVNSPIHTVADLKGKTIGLVKGTTANCLLMRALLASHLTLGDVHISQLTPPDARAAFARGSIDAWVIWDPFYSQVLSQGQGRLICDATGYMTDRDYYLAGATFVDQNPAVVKTILQQIGVTDTWITAHKHDVAVLMSPDVGLDVPTLDLVMKNRTFAESPITPVAIDYQQKLANTFYNLGILPTPIHVKDAVWTDPSAHGLRSTTSVRNESGAQSLARITKIVLSCLLPIALIFAWQILPARGSVQPRSNGQLSQIVLSWLVPAILIVVWQILATDGVISPRTLPPPTSILAAAVRLWRNGQLPAAIAISTQRALLGFLIGGAAGFLLGLLNGLFPLAETLLDSSIQMVRNIPHLALIPLVILWFGIGEPAKLFLVTLGVFFPIYLNTFHGIRSIDPGLREMAEVYGVRPWSMFKDIILPGAMPSILVGVRYALGLMWLTLIVAETIASDSGIGYITMNARDFMQTDVVLMGIVIYAILGKLADTIARLLERLLLRWQPAYQK